ncbi:hypothetical protein LCGC14_1947360 [marine sediment metagenome]|uniref:Uncharacterized protein n=1 Tax=marine sediment metagenome TaxID=412755 RepID=A0A0F9IFJ0_9ZZZZ
MKLEIEKSHCQGIDLVTKNQLILQVEKAGVYRYYVHQQSVVPNGFRVDRNCQIEEERDI